MPDISYDTGSTGIFINSRDGYTVRKKMRNTAQGRSIGMQKLLHRAALRELTESNNYDILRAPFLEDEQNSQVYEMQKIDTSTPLWLGDSESIEALDNNFKEDLTLELVRFWKAMWNDGYAPWDFMLFLQPRTGKVMILGFTRWGQRISDNNISTPTPCPLTQFFDHPCFPVDFYRRLNILLNPAVGPVSSSYVAVRD